MSKFIMIFSIVLSLIFISVLMGKTVQDFKVYGARYERGDTAVAVSYKKVRGKNGH